MSGCKDNPTRVIDEKIAKLLAMSTDEKRTAIEKAARDVLSTMDAKKRRALVVQALITKLDRGASFADIMAVAHHPQIQRFPELKYALCDFDLAFQQHSRFMVRAMLICGKRNQTP